MTTTSSRFLLICLLSGFSFLQAQAPDSWQAPPRLQLGGVVDVFYAFDFNQPTGDARQPYFFAHNRHNEFNLNQGMISLEVDHDRYRAILALQTGTYAIDNYAAEPTLLQHLFEAYAGIALDKKARLWLDAGVFSAPIGFEGAISSENWTLTRSLLAEHSPYYLSGLRLSYQLAPAWEVKAVICNGWQRIRRLPGNSLLSFSGNITYNPSDKLTLNYSTFIGTDTPDSTRQMRHFHNFFAKLGLSERLGLIAGFDVGWQQQEMGSSSYDLWLTPILIARYQLADRWATALRVERFQDPEEVVVTTGTPAGFSLNGVSLNLDYQPVEQVACRLEARYFQAEDAIFEGAQGPSANNLAVVASLSIKLDRE
jgi:hypothetical protein